MAKYGAYFASGSMGWVTPDTIPMHFIKKIQNVVSMGNGVTSALLDTGVSSSIAMIPFVQVEGDSATVSIEIEVRNGRWGVVFGRDSGSSAAISFTARVYVFYTQVPQPMPKYGMAIFNASGQCILTNETNPLRIFDTVTLKSSGLNVPAETKTYAGKSIAIYPQSTGYTVGNIQGPSGPPLIVQAFSSYCARKIGSNTLVTPAYRRGTSGSVNFWFTPSIPTYVIDTSYYD